MTVKSIDPPDISSSAENSFLLDYRWKNQRKERYLSKCAHKQGGEGENLPSDLVVKRVRGEGQE